MAASRGAVSRRGLSERSKIVSDSSSSRPGWRSAHASVSANDGTSATGDDELLDLGHADRLALGPRRDLVDLVREAVEVVLADVLDQERARIGLGLDPGLPEALGDPGDAAALGDVVDQEVAAPSRTPSRARRPSSPRGRRARARCRERALRGRSRSPRRRRPSSRPSAGGSSFFCAVDVRDDHEPRVAEEAARVAERDDVGAARPRAPRRSRPTRARTAHAAAGPPSRPSAGRCPRSGRPASGRAVRSSDLPY